MIDLIAENRVRKVSRAMSRQSYPNCDDSDRAILNKLAVLSGLSNCERLLVARFLDQGVVTRCDRACLNAMAGRHLCNQ